MPFSNDLWWLHNAYAICIVHNETIFEVVNYIWYEALTIVMDHVTFVLYFSNEVINIIHSYLKNIAPMTWYGQIDLAHENMKIWIGKREVIWIMLMTYYP